MLKKIVKWLLPDAVYNFVRMKPRVMIVSESLKNKMTYINKAAWRQDPDYRGDNSGALRKFGHMVDKGLQSKKREAGHGLPIANRLGELLAVREEECNSSLWAAEILKLHNDLQQSEIASGTYANFPYHKDTTISSEQLLDFFKERRTLRHFDDQLIPNKADISKILESSIWAPSSCNRQTIVNYFTLNETLANECTKQNKGATAISGKYAFISVCYDSRSYHLPQESFTGLIDASLGFENALLMVHSIGLGACVLNWSHSDELENKKLRRLLDIPDYCEIAFNVIVGIPKGGAPVPGKKNITEYAIER